MITTWYEKPPGRDRFDSPEEPKALDLRVFLSDFTRFPILDRLLKNDASSQHFLLSVEDC
jgi:hypothetical protein